MGDNLVSVIEAQKVILAHVAIADGHLRQAEVNTAIAMAKEVPWMPRETPKSIRTQMRYLEKADVDAAIERVRTLPLAERVRTVKLMWVMALCDGELHPQEEIVIYGMADQLGVDRATVISVQPDF